MEKDSSKGALCLSAPRPRHRQIGLCYAGALALALSLASAPASALLCSTADPTFVPGGTGFSLPADVINTIFVQSGRNTPQTLSYVSGSTAYQLTNSGPFITARTFVYDPNQLQSGAVGSFLLPLAQLRGLTQAQYLDFWALPNTPGTPRNNAVALTVVPPGTTLWSGIAGPITDANGNFWVTAQVGRPR